MDVFGTKNSHNHPNGEVPFIVGYFSSRFRQSWKFFNEKKSLESSIFIIFWSSMSTPQEGELPENGAAESEAAAAKRAILN